MPSTPYTLRGEVQQDARHAQVRRTWEAVRSNVYPTLVRVGPRGAGMRLRNPIAWRGGAYFEGHKQGIAYLMAIDRDGPAREIASITGHQDGALIACVDEGLVCRRPDDSLVVIAHDGARRHELCKLAPGVTGTAIAVTPEHVVWCSARRVHRWWRETERVEDLGEHEARFPPLLAVRPAPRPYPPERLAADVAIAAGTRLGLIDADELDWLTEVDGEPLYMACDEGAIYAVTRAELVRFDLDTDTLTQLHERKRGAPLVGVAARDGAAYLATNSMMRTGERARVIRFEAGERADLAGTDDDTWLRAGRQLAVTPRGVLVTEDASLTDGVDRASFIPFGGRVADARSTLQLHRWKDDGAGAQMIIENGAWHCGMAAGSLSHAAVLDIDAWLRDNAPRAVRTREIVPGGRGWQVAIGNLLWTRLDYDFDQSARAIDALVEILAREIPFMRSL